MDIPHPCTSTLNLSHCVWFELDMPMEMALPLSRRQPIEVDRQSYRRSYMIAILFPRIELMLLSCRKVTYVYRVVIFCLYA